MPRTKPRRQITRPKPVRRIKGEAPGTQGVVAQSPDAALLEAAKQVAPLVWLHPEESYLPMDPIEFIRSSRLRHHKSWADDEGYNKRLQRWVETNSHDRAYYNIRLSFVNSLGVHPDGKTRRPRDDNRGSKLNVFLQPRDRPQGTPDVNSKIPVFVYKKRVSAVHFEGRADAIQFWWFFGYNDGPSKQNHQGDWEHVTAILQEDQFLGYYMAGHGNAKWHPRSTLERDGGRYVVYVAKGTHAAHPRVGSFDLPLWFEEHTGKGIAWRPWQKLEVLRNQPWKDFAGAWGEVGAHTHTTGPLGPWIKRSSGM